MSSGCARTYELRLSILAGAWFCSSECSGISTTLREHVQAGPRPVEGAEDYTWQIMRVRLQPCLARVSVQEAWLPSLYENPLHGNIHRLNLYRTLLMCKCLSCLSHLHQHLSQSITAVLDAL